MRLIVETIEGEVGVVVGYGPGANGSPRAIVVFSNGNLQDFSLSEIKVAEFAKKAKRKIRKNFEAMVESISQEKH